MKPARRKREPEPPSGDEEHEEEEEIEDPYIGRRLTGDHFITLAEDELGIEGEPCGLVMFDRDTKWLDTYPLRSKDADATYSALMHFIGPKDYVGGLYSDGSGEIEGACSQAGIRHYQNPRPIK